MPSAFTAGCRAAHAELCDRAPLTAGISSAESQGSLDRSPSPNDQGSEAADHAEGDQYEGDQRSEMEPELHSMAVGDHSMRRAKPSKGNPHARNAVPPPRNGSRHQRVSVCMCMCMCLPPRHAALHPILGGAYNRNRLAAAAAKRRVDREAGVSYAAPRMTQKEHSHSKW